MSSTHSKYTSKLLNRTPQNNDILHGIIVLTSHLKFILLFSKIHEGVINQYLVPYFQSFRKPPTLMAYSNCSVWADLLRSRRRSLLRPKAGTSLSLTFLHPHCYRVHSELGRRTKTNVQTHRYNRYSPLSINRGVILQKSYKKWSKMAKV